VGSLTWTTSLDYPLKWSPFLMVPIKSPFLINPPPPGNSQTPAAMPWTPPLAPGTGSEACSASGAHG
jgi:hypothetical protein